MFGEERCFEVLQENLGCGFILQQMDDLRFSEGSTRTAKLSEFLGEQKR